jgi:hypothetical protein
MPAHFHCQGQAFCLIWKGPDGRPIIRASTATSDDPNPLFRPTSPNSDIVSSCIAADATLGWLLAEDLWDSPVVLDPNEEDASRELTTVQALRVWTIWSVYQSD